MYIFFSGYYRSFGIDCLRFIIQSDAADPAALDARLEAFLTSFASTVLRPMTSEAFAAQKAAVIANTL